LTGVVVAELCPAQRSSRHPVRTVEVTMYTSLAAFGRRGAVWLLLVLMTTLWGCASQPSAAEADARSRVRFEDSPDGARAIVSESILFESGKTTFANAAEPVLDLLKPAFAKARGRIIVEGHTDSTGSEAFNRKLSVDRAETVRRAVVARQVPPNRVEARGLGKDKPRRSPEVTDEDRQLNRRAEILFPGETVDSLGGREIEGKVDNVLAQLSKALGQVKDEAKGLYQQLRDKIKGDSKP
jgi:outer membrane protein OmpA-like peptidoglycan-associated protein